MILWITGNSGAGKSTLAHKLAGRNTIILDGDEMRGSISNDLDLSREGRSENCLRIARLATVLESQGFAVIVAAICPFNYLQAQVKAITDCSFIYLKGGKSGGEHPYEPPIDATITINARDE